jgi:hypothetical protein
LFLDEGISGKALSSLLLKARIPVFEYDFLLTRNSKIPDGDVLKRSVEAGFILVSKDSSMVSDELDHIIKHRARVIFLDDQHGGPVTWAASLICGHIAYERVLLSNPKGPLTIHLTCEGKVRETVGEAELRRKFQRLSAKNVIREKRHRKMVEREAVAVRK